MELVVGTWSGIIIGFSLNRMVGYAVEAASGSTTILESRGVIDMTVGGFVGGKIGVSHIRIKKAIHGSMEET